MVAGHAPLAKRKVEPELHYGSSALLSLVEGGLRQALEASTASTTPPRLASALHYAVLSGGSRLRPQLALMTAIALGAKEMDAAVLAAACSVELMHCASLVHDDMPCFDNAETRRGKPTVHRAYSEATAVLVGDGLIVIAFEQLARGLHALPASRLAAAIAMLGEAAGAARGIVAGQAWEEETTVALAEYHRAKTASLFGCASGLGALCAGAQAEPWRAFGNALGLAYQIADDMRDVAGDPNVLGKPVGQDEALGRPNLARAQGIQTARAHLHKAIETAIATVPPTLRREIVVNWVRDFAAPLLREA
jgi:geranylgeranyl diphosphate synthase, type II